MKIFSPILKGTTTVSQGTTNLSGSFTGSLFGTAATASYADNFTVGGTLTAQTINVQIITSSIEFNTGSTRNGALSTNTHQFTGSVSVSGTLSATDFIRGTCTTSYNGDGIRVYATATGAGGSQPGIGFWTAAGSKRFITQLDVSTDTWNVVNATGTNLVTITQSGSVGIGTTSPSQRLALNQGATGFNQGIPATSGTTQNGILRIQPAVGTFGETLDIGMNVVSTYAWLQSTNAGNLGVNYNLVLNPNGGNVLVGTATDNGYKLNVSGNIYASSNMYAVGGIGAQGNIYTDYGYGFGLNSNNQVAANGWNFYVSTSFSNNLRFFYGGTGVGSGTAKAQIDTSGNYSALSDINKKKNIALSTLGLNEVLQLRPSTFKFKDDVNNEEQLGFIAQEVKDIIPHAYYEDAEGDDKFIGLKYNAMVPVLVKAIQELKSENDTLKEILQRNNIQ